VVTGSIRDVPGLNVAAVLRKPAATDLLVAAVRNALFDYTGVTAGIRPSPTTGNIVWYHTDGADTIHGKLSFTCCVAGSAEGGALFAPDFGFATVSGPLASPEHYMDVVFNAAAGVHYTLWLRLRAKDDSKWNDSVWVQFSDALVNDSPIYRMNTGSGLLINLATDWTASSLNGWGWANGAYWLSQPTTVTFGSTGPHTLRIQVREDGFWLDQIVLSPAQYLNTSPGPPTNDSTIVAKP
jgi:hypothetical protein